MHQNSNTGFVQAVGCVFSPYSHQWTYITVGERVIHFIIWGLLSRGCERKNIYFIYNVIFNILIYKNIFFIFLMESAQSGPGILAQDPPRLHSILSFRAQPPPTSTFYQPGPFQSNHSYPAPCWSYDLLCFSTFSSPLIVQPDTPIQVLPLLLIRGLNLCK